MNNKVKHSLEKREGANTGYVWKATITMYGPTTDKKRQTFAALPYDRYQVHHGEPTWFLLTDTDSSSVYLEHVKIVCTWLNTICTEMFKTFVPFDKNANPENCCINI